MTFFKAAFLRAGGSLLEHDGVHLGAKGAAALTLKSNWMSMYLPKRLELSLRNVLALPKAWRRKEEAEEEKARRADETQCKESTVAVVSATVAQITGHARRSHTCTHLENIWLRHIKNKVLW